jgi:enterochelin esterase-like enzyme
LRFSDGTSAYVASASVRLRSHDIGTVVAVAWLAVGLSGAYRYVHRYDQYRGFAPPSTPAGVARGAVRQMRFYSRAAGGENRYLVYLPPGYDRRRRYPVMYLLHGVPGKADVFTTVDPVQVFANVLLAQHRIKPMIIVMPAGLQGTFVGDTEWANTASGRWMDFVLDVEHDVDRRFATIADRRHRGIAGDSEGAYGAINVALHHLGDFSVAESWGGYFTQEATGPFAGASAAQLRANSPAAYVASLTPAIHRLGFRSWLYQGRTDSDSQPGALRSFSGALHRAGADVRYGYFPGGHDWRLFRTLTPRMLTAASRWFGQPPGTRAAYRGVGHALPGTTVRRIQARRRQCRRQQLGKAPVRISHCPSLHELSPFN